MKQTARRARGQFLLHSVAVWFGVLSVAILVRLWFGPLTIYESNRIVLAVETALAFLIALAAICGFVRLVVALRKPARHRLERGPSLQSPASR